MVSCYSEILLLSWISFCKGISQGKVMCLTAKDTKMQQTTLQWDRRKKLLLTKGAEHWGKWPRDIWISILGDLQNLPEWGPEQADLARKPALLWEGGWTSSPGLIQTSVFFWFQDHFLGECFQPSTGSHSPWRLFAGYPFMHPLALQSGKYCIWWLGKHLCLSNSNQPAMV